VKSLARVGPSVSIAVFVLGCSADTSGLLGCPDASHCPARDASHAADASALPDAALADALPDAAPPDALPDAALDASCPPPIASGGQGVAVLGGPCTPGAPQCEVGQGGATYAFCATPENVWAYCSDRVVCDLPSDSAGKPCCYSDVCNLLAPDSGVDSGVQCQCNGGTRHAFCQ
jgi:hypothetical protein